MQGGDRMSDCCSSTDTNGALASDASCSIEVNDVVTKENVDPVVCPSCEQSGTSIGLITVKSMLQPNALAELDPKQEFRFCASPSCEIVYFGNKGQHFRLTNLRRAVFQKSQDEQVEVCYCFGWNRIRMKTELEEDGQSTAVSSISAHIKAGRCACEINNPQGSCCLGNVAKVVKEVRESLHG